MYSGMENRIETVMLWTVFTVQGLFVRTERAESRIETTIVLVTK